MKISVNWLKEYTKIDLAIDELVGKIGSQLGEVESVTNLGDKYKGALIVKVVSCKNHPDADKLHVCKIDDGRSVKGIERDEDGYIQIVCGANNVAAGQTVIWLPPGMTVPETHGNPEPHILEARELRGVKSYGMIASARELMFGNDHDGIVVVDEDIKPGTTLVEAFGLDDYIIDIENKMFTHRPDCFGILGVAREIAGIQNIQFKSPDWYLKGSSELGARGSKILPLTVKNELPDLVPRFMAVAMSNIIVKPSPLKLQTYLARIGIHPINNVVDITNYFMMLTGQPLHAYDYDMVFAGEKETVLMIRPPRDSEVIELLNGKTIRPGSADIMIATNHKLLGVGGAMGGVDTEVNKNTKNIILECANFDMYSVRKTAMTLGIFTDAITRFTKGQSPLQNDKVLAQAMLMVQKHASGQVASPIIDSKCPQPKSATEVTPAFVNQRLGLELNDKQISRSLQNVEFKIKKRGPKLKIEPPFWRTDIAIPEDIVEEVGRLIGYDKLPLDLPKRSLKPVKTNNLLDLKTTIRQILQAAGANELLTYSFVHGNLIDGAGQNRELAFGLSNALSPDLQYYRLSLIPSLLEKVHPNVKTGYSQFALFELGKAHIKGWLDDEKLPKEEQRLALIFAADNKAATGYGGAAFYQTRQYLMELLGHFGINPIFVPLPADFKLKINSQLAAPFAPGRSATINDANGKFIGVLGEFKPSVLAALKLPDYCAGFEIDITKLLDPQNAGKTYTPLSKFPKVEQDISLKIDSKLTYAQVYDFIKSELKKLQPEHCALTLSSLDIFQRAGDKTHKQMAFRLKIASYEKTLSSGEVNDLLDAVAVSAAKKFGAKRL